MDEYCRCELQNRTLKAPCGDGIKITREKKAKEVKKKQGEREVEEKGKWKRKGKEVEVLGLRKAARGLHDEHSFQKRGTT